MIFLFIDLGWFIRSSILAHHSFSSFFHEDIFWFFFWLSSIHHDIVFLTFIEESFGCFLDIFFDNINGNINKLIQRAYIFIWHNLSIIINYYYLKMQGKWILKKLKFLFFLGGTACEECFQTCSSQMRRKSRLYEFFGACNPSHRFYQKEKAWPSWE